MGCTQVFLFYFCSFFVKKQRNKEKWKESGLVMVREKGCDKVIIHKYECERGTVEMVRILI